MSCKCFGKLECFRQAICCVPVFYPIYTSIISDSCGIIVIEKCRRRGINSSSSIEIPALIVLAA